MKFGKFQCPCPLSFLVLIFLVVPVGAHAQRACQDNFSESGRWSSGKSFKTFVEAEETTYDEAFLTVTRSIATEGFLGLNSNKEIGVVSAYQENNGKKSTIVAVVSEASPGLIRVEATFKLAGGLRAPVAAVRDHLCTLVEPVLSQRQQQAAAEAGSGVTLRTEGEQVPLSFEIGEFRQAGVAPVMLLYFDFEGAQAETRSDHRQPSILVRAVGDPSDSYLLVRCDSSAEEDMRSVKVGSAGKLVKLGLTGKGDLAPDKDWTLPYSSEAEEPGLWRLTPNTDLPPGEYGLWDVKGYGVALFGID